METLPHITYKTNEVVNISYGPNLRNLNQRSSKLTKGSQ